MAYALKLDDKVMPLSGLIDPQILINGGRNTIFYEQDPAIRSRHVQAVRDESFAAVVRESLRSALLPAEGPRAGQLGKSECFAC